MERTREGKRQRPARSFVPAPRSAPVTEPQHAALSGSNAIASLPRKTLPHREALEELFATSLASIAAITGFDELRDSDAVAAAIDEIVLFADAAPSLGVTAHEVAHVLQRRARRGVGPRDRAEAEARTAREHAESGRSGPFVVDALPSDRVQFDDGKHAPPPKHQDPAPTNLTSPFAASIERDFANGAIPMQVPYKLTITAPGDSRKPPEHVDVPLEQPVLAASMVTIYLVPLDQLFPSAAAAEKERREHHGVAAAPYRPTPKATPPATTKPPSPAVVPPVQQAGLPAPAATGKISEVTPPSTGGETLYTRAGEPIKLVERAAGWGITMEFTKLAVGAASCGVLRTATGITLVDAGVRSPGGVPDPKVVEYCRTRLRELVVTQGGTKAPIENLLITHTHLDHTAMLEMISQEFIVKKITVNVAQYHDPAFREALAKMAEHQLEVHRAEIEAQVRAEHDTWANTDEALAAIEKGKKAEVFEDHVKAETAKRLKTVKPLAVDVQVPAGTGGKTIVVEVPGVDIVPREVHPGEAGTYVARDGFGTTLIDKSFGERAETQAKQLREDPKAKIEVIDPTASNFVIETPAGPLVVVSDIRASELIHIRDELVKAVKKLGGDVSFLDIAHHHQSTFLGEAAGPHPRIEGGLIRASELARLTEVITKLSRATKGGTFAITSGEAKLIDPATLHFLDRCGVTVMPTLDPIDTQYIAAITAKGEKIGGFTSGEAIKIESVALLQRADAVLDKLREELERADRRVVEEKRDQHDEAEALKSDRALDRQADVETRDQLKADVATRDKSFAERRAAGGKVSRAEIKDLATLRARRDALAKRVNALAAKADADAKAIIERVGPAQEHRQELVDKINDIQKAKEQLLGKLKETSQSTRDTSSREPAPDKLAADEKHLADKVDPLFEQGVKEGHFARITETSLLLLGKALKRTTANAALLDAWKAAHEARLAAAAPGASIEEHLELLKRLATLQDEIKKRPDIADQKAVEHELEFIGDQIKQSTKLLEEEVERRGKVTEDVDPLTGDVVKNTVVAEKTAEDATKDAEAKPADPAAPKPEEDPAKSKEEAKPGETAPTAVKPTKLAKAVNTGAQVVGRGMGGLMVFQNITAGSALLQRYEAGQANLPETALGLAKSAYGVSIGYRMLRGIHVGAAEFLLVSALEVGQALVGDYTSTAEFNTEVTYALISAGINAALMFIGMALMELGPFGVIAGMIVMALGEPILNFLGIKAWLAKMFDPRPNENIDLEKDLAQNLEGYAVMVGAAELVAEKDERLKAFGAKDPKELRDATSAAMQGSRGEMLRREAELMTSFDDAYKRAQQGYVGLKWLDDQRARFVTLYLRVHKNDEVPEGEDPMNGYLTKKEMLSRLAATEDIVSLREIKPEDIPGMEQWTKLDKWIGEAVKLLYHTSYDPTNYDFIDWMKVYEAISMIEQMIVNARYRLEPAKYGAQRAEPLLPPGPARVAYEAKLLEYENKADVIRERTLDMSMGGGMDSGVKVPAHWSDLDPKAAGSRFGNQRTLIPATYYEPDYGNTSQVPTDEALLARTEHIVLWYVNLVMTSGDLPDGVTLSKLKSDVDVVKKYRDALKDDDDYKDRMFRLQAGRAVTVGAIERAVRVLGGKPSAKERLDKLGADFDTYDKQRLTEDGYYFAEELPALENKIGVAHTLAASSLIGEGENSPQLSDMEHATLADDYMSRFHLSTIRDRVIKANIVLPRNPDEPIRRMYCITTRHDVLVGLKADAKTHYQATGQADQLVQVYDEVIPLNDAAVAYFGDRGDQTAAVHTLLPVTINNLLGKSQIPDLFPAPHTIVMKNTSMTPRFRR